MERRAVERILAAVPVTCSAAGRAERACTYDLSTDGCMVQATAGLLEAGTPVELAFGPRVVEGTVVWARHRNAGIRFAERLDWLTVNQLVATSRGKAREPAAPVATREPVLAFAGDAALPARPLKAALALHDVVCGLLVVACAWVLVAG